MMAVPKKQLSVFLLLIIPLFNSINCPAQTDDSSSDDSISTDDSNSLERMIDPKFATAAFWDDGRSEVATYRATRYIYGEDRPHTAYLITVFEDFNREYYSKADWPYGQKPLLPVIKQNMISTVPTPNYSYHIASSVFVEREKFWKLVKLTATSHEWCGITTKQFEMWLDTPKMKYFSYWDGEGSGEQALSASTDIFFEEQLFLVFRGLDFESLPSGTFRLYGTQVTNHAPRPSASPATFEVLDSGDTWRVDVYTMDERSMTFEYEKEYPYVLTGFSHSDGRAMELESVERKQYWVLRE